MHVLAWEVMWLIAKSYFYLFAELAAAAVKALSANTTRVVLTR